MFLKQTRCVLTEIPKVAETTTLQVSFSNLCNVTNINLPEDPTDDYLVGVLVELIDRIALDLEGIAGKLNITMENLIAVQAELVNLLNDNHGTIQAVLGEEHE